MATILCGNCKQTHTSVQAVKDCYAGKLDMTVIVEHTDEQVFERIAANEERSARYERAAQDRYDRTRAMVERPNIGTDDAGIYHFKGVIYKVYKAQTHNTMLVKELKITKGEKGVWEYIGSARKALPFQAQKLTLEDAKQYGAVYGICCVCGAILTNVVSIEAGIGPICGGRL